jgi:hypothetical protein
MRETGGCKICGETLSEGKYASAGLQLLEGMAGSDGILSFGRGRGLATRACISRFRRVRARARAAGRRARRGGIAETGERERERQRQPVSACVCVRALIMLAWASVISLSAHCMSHVDPHVLTSFSTSHRPPRPIPGESTFNVPHRPRSSFIENTTPRSALGSDHGFAYHS